MKRYRLLIPALLSVAALTASAQMSFDEAQRKLNAKLATRPASTQPVSPLEQLRRENLRLQEENTKLSIEVDQLREALANSMSTTNPSSQPTLLAGGQVNQLVGQWHGGSLIDSNAFDIQFSSDGSYVQTWTAYPHREPGHWELSDNGILQMWTNATSDTAKHNHWRATFGKDAAGKEQVVLTPLNVNDSEIPNAKQITLTHAK